MHNLVELTRIVDDFCQQYQLISPGDRIVIGLSGGPDSVLLTYILNNLKNKYNLYLVGAHLNHGWRSESTQEAIFCKDLCLKLGIPLVVEKAQNIQLPPNKTIRGSKENLGRQLRRTFFESVREQNTANKIALAHHADDQVETFFIRLIRGATITGLSAMRPLANRYIRPLLTLKKKEIETILHNLKIPFCVDPTNQSLDYLRNRIRNQLLPLLNQIDPRSTDATLKAISHLQDAEELIIETTQNTYNQLIKKDFTLNYYGLIHLPSRYLQRRILVEWLIESRFPLQPSQKFLDEILRFFLQSKSHRHQLSPEWSIIKKQSYAKLIRNIK